MSSILRISEATSLGLHAMVLMAERPESPISCKEIAASFGVSQAHLAKVLQRMAKLGLVRSLRGAGGGFMLARPAERIALLHIYEAIEGPLALGNCLLASPACDQRVCVLGDLLESFTAQFVDYMAKTRLSDIAGEAVASRTVPQSDGRPGESTRDE
jgi:Rrf2 family protein